MRQSYSQLLTDPIGLATIDVQISQTDGCYLITRVMVPIAHREKGIGTALLARVCEDADAKNATLFLYPSSYGAYSNRRLRKWYRDRGFISKGSAMWRVPNV